MLASVPPAVAQRSCRLLGLEFTDLDVAAAATVILERPADAPFSYVVTPNADHLVRMSRDASLPPLYQKALMRLLDSRVVARAARMLGLAAPCVTTGSDLTARLLEVHPASEPITVIGLRDAHLDELVRRTGMARPAHFDPPMGFDRDAELMRRTIRFVVEHPARLVFLAVGSPRQEKLAAAIMASGEATGVGLCIGASLEFLSGAVPRAPVFMRHAGVEWLHRMMSDPRRLARRYLIDSPPIFRLLLRERLTARAG